MRFAHERIIVNPKHYFVSTHHILVPKIAEYGGRRTLSEFYENYRDNQPYPAYWRDDNINCRPHFHSSIEMIYVADGCLQAVIEGRPYSIGQGRILILSSYTVHSFIRDGKSKTIVMIVPLDFIPAYTTVLARKKFTDCICGEKTVNSEVLHCLEQMLTLGECTESNANIIKGYMYVVLGLIVNYLGLVDSGEQDNALSKEILSYLQDNYLLPISLDTLSRDFGYSKYRFSHIFSALFGCSLTEYVNSLRARHAANLLAETGLPLIEVAMSSGYESMRTFYRAFKVNFGVTPSEYRCHYIASQ